MGGDPALSLYLKVASVADWFQRRRDRTPTEHTDPSVRHPGLVRGPGRDRQNRGLVWIHGSSLAELAPIRPLVNRLAEFRGEDLATLVTSPAPLPADLIDSDLHQPAPPDSVPSAEEFFDRWWPDLALFVGGSLAPAAMQVASARNVPAFWLNAHWDRSANWWRPWIRGAVESGFTMIYPSSADDAHHLARLGVAPSRIGPTGQLREEARVLPCNDADHGAVSADLGGRPVWLAAPLDLTECDAVSAAHRHATRHSHRLLLIIVPKDLGAGSAVAAEFAERGWTVGLRSLGDTPTAETQVYVADTEGEMGLWYRLAPITFVGNTLADPGGGRNPLEPAALGSAVVHGPFVGHHRPRFDRLARAGAALLVSSGRLLGEAVAGLLAPDKAAEMAGAAWQVTSEGAETADRLVEVLSDALDRREAVP